LLDADSQADELDMVFASCPVCGSQAKVIGTLADDGEYTDGEHSWTWSPEMVICAGRFDCRVCGLSLTTNQHDSANVPRLIPHPTAQPHDVNQPYDEQ
jgi:hypothetical protein